MHETFPSGNPEFSSALTGESEAEEVAKVFSIRIEIPRWDLGKWRGGTGVQIPF
jgi:hypothetical protein